MFRKLKEDKESAESSHAEGDKKSALSTDSTPSAETASITSPSAPGGDTSAVPSSPARGRSSSGNVFTGATAESPRGLTAATLLGASPPHFIQFDDLMKVAESFTDMSLAHEISVDENFRLEKQEPPENSLERRVRDTMVQAFWDVLRSELENDPPIYDRVLALLQEIKETLLGFLTERNVRMRQHIEEHLDMELIRQQLQHGSLDLHSYAAYVVHTMGKMCAPVRDEEVARLRNIQDPVDLLKEVFRVLDLMKMDMANFSIAQIRPFIQRNSVEYERNKFQEYLTAQKNAGLGELDMTRYWLHGAHHRLQQPQGDHLTNSTGVAVTPYNILTEACLELFEWPLDKVYPETFQLDEHRVRTLVEATHHLVMTAAVILITHNAVNAEMRTVPTITTVLTQLRPTLKEHIIALLRDVLTRDFPNHAANLALQVSKDVNVLLEKSSLPSMNALMEESLKKQISDAMSGTNSVVQLLRTRLYGFLHQSVLSNNPQQRQQFPSGFSVVEQELNEVCGQLMRLFAHNRAVFGPYYADILQPLVKSQEGMSPAHTPRK